MTLRGIERQLRELGFADWQIETATIHGKPLSEIESVAKLPPKRKDLADDFCRLWGELGDGTPYEREHRFHSTRKWRFDVAFVEQQLAVELEGGIWTRGRHTRGAGYKADMEKYNAAQQLGWRVLRFAANDLELSAEETMRQVREALTAAPAAKE